MSNLIDKIAYIHIVDKKILMTLSKGKSTYYIPGGKREIGESDEQCLIREVKEELSVDVIPDTIKYYDTFRAQAHGKAEGVIVQMTCYKADYEGDFQPSSEISDFTFYDYSKRDIIGPVDQIIFDDLKLHNKII